jgi:Tfp pilus assembly protein PilF
MKIFRRGKWVALIFGSGCFLCSGALAAPAPPPPARVLTTNGVVEFLRDKTVQWYDAPAGLPLVVLDRLRTLENGRAVVQMQDLSQLRMNPRSELVITPPRAGTAKARIDVERGLFYFLHRNRPGEVEVDTPVGTAAIEGTEFVLSVDEVSGATILSLINGRVELANAFGKVTLVSGEEGVMERGQPPRKTAVIETKNVVQWFLYYPGVVDPDELKLDRDSSTALAASLAAYREGDLLRALSAYPAGRTPASADERIYLEALRISSGRATNYDSLLPETDAAQPLAVALQNLVAAVRLKTFDRPLSVTNASAWLGISYYRQSQHDLEGARLAARNAVQISTNFAFGWARVAELEFSFGRTAAAERALDRALELAPRHAQAHALRGFLLLARGRSAGAEQSFTNAMEIDPMLGNAWLGRGLGRILAGRVSEGRQDLQTAALLEPNRSLLRSYLGKSYAHEALFTRDAKARKQLRSLADAELHLAKESDPLDPTPWLYSALLKYDEYRAAEAIQDLEESARLNDNRQVYRSRLLLDQDQAVRSANLANVFEDAGMTDVGLRESARSVAYDYGNYSAHLNLASSFNAMRDPTRFNLRFESEWFNEHLLASLLAPVGAASLSQNLSQQEYSRLFAVDRFGLSGTTEYFSNGEWRQTATQFGTFGQTSYAVDLDYQNKEGVRHNNDLSRIEWYSRIKQQITRQDSLLLLTKYQDYDSGDNFQYYSPSVARRSFRYEETQAPLLLAGWHHEWSPGVHTLFLGGRLVNDQNVGDAQAKQQLAFVNPVDIFDPTNTVPFDVKYHSEFETYSAELNQIIQRERHTDIVGMRYQDGRFTAKAVLDNPPAPLAPFVSVPDISRTSADFQRLSLYAYHHWEIVDGLLLIGGVAYDDLTYPANFRRPPLSSRERDKQRWSPKAALIWHAAAPVTVRGIFSRAVGGVSYDESVRLEPAQLAGFGQSFRSVISESLVGSVEAPEYEIAGGALDLKLRTNTWLSLQGEALRGEVDGTYGLFLYNAFASPAIIPGRTRERLDYHEWQTRVVLNQILGREWFAEAQYQFTRSELDRNLPTIPASPGYARTTTMQGDLHEVRLALTWRGTSGLFARGEFWWFLQELDGSKAPPPGDHFPQLNLYAGYRFPNRRADFTIGVLNATGDNYRLSPLNYYSELPRERLFYARLRFNFWR